MKKIFIDYGERINTAILGVIKDILRDLEESKISSNHCFYITFKTKNSKVEIPKHLLQEYHCLSFDMANMKTQQLPHKKDQYQPN